MSILPVKKRRPLPAILILLLSAGMLPSMPPGRSDISTEGVVNPSLVVAVGDVHGDFDSFCTILKRAGLIDEQRRWTGAASVFVQTGDLIDRGAKGREAMDFLISLERMAASAGGQVIPLLGNHEVMNLVGDLRYVSADDYGHYADAGSEKRRKAAYDQYDAWRARHDRMLAAIQQPVFPAGEEQWMAEHPLGFLEHREAFSESGVYGKWLRSHDTVTKISDLIFLHGGIDSTLTATKLDQINARVQEGLRDFDSAKQYLISRDIVLPFFTFQEIAAAVQAAGRASEATQDGEWQARSAGILRFGNSLSMRQDGPLWFRGYDQWTDDEGLSQIERILTAYDAKHIIVGHTVQQTARIRTRFTGRVFLIDTGMLSAYWHGGRASALVIRDGRKFMAVYPDSEELLFEEKGQSQAPAEQLTLFVALGTDRIPLHLFASRGTDWDGRRLRAESARVPWSTRILGFGSRKR